MGGGSSCRSCAGPAWSPPGPGFAPSRSTSAWPTPAVSACSQAGLVNNLNDALAWGLLPLLFVRGGLAVGQVGPLSDRLGRKPLITGGMLLQASALAGTALAGSFAPSAGSAILPGAGTAMVYPTLLAAVGDVAHPSWRASAVGVYRSWRDTGFAVGALLAGLVVAVRMYETHPSAARA